MVQTMKRWLLIGFLVIAVGMAVAIALGGFLWPRPQFQRGPWAIEQEPPLE